MECILHYDGLKAYDPLSPITSKTEERILLARTLHQNSEDRSHDVQCNSIPPGNLTDYSCHKNPCYKKFVRIVQSTSAVTPKSIATPSKADSNIKTRSKQTSSTKFEELKPPPKKSAKVQPEKRVLHRRGSLSLATSSSRNKFVFGKECVLCDRYELRYKKDGETVREEPFPVTLESTAKNILAQLEKNKEKYGELLHRLILVDDIISAEFKYHDYCRKELLRDDRTSAVVGRPNVGFDKVKDYIDNYILKVNQVVSMNVIYELCYCDKDAQGVCVKA